MKLNYLLLAQMAGVFLLLAVVLARMAINRGLSSAAWVLIAFIPFLNLVGLVLLAFKPKSKAYVS